MSNREMTWNGFNNLIRIHRVKNRAITPTRVWEMHGAIYIVWIFFSIALRAIASPSNPFEITSKLSSSLLILGIKQVIPNLRVQITVEEVVTRGRNECSVEVSLFALQDCTQKVIYVITTIKAKPSKRAAILARLSASPLDRETNGFTNVQARLAEESIWKPELKFKMTTFRFPLHSSEF